MSGQTNAWRLSVESLLWVLLLQIGSGIVVINVIWCHWPKSDSHDVWLSVIFSLESWFLKVLSPLDGVRRAKMSQVNIKVLLVPYVGSSKFFVAARNLHSRFHHNWQKVWWLLTRGAARRIYIQITHKNPWRDFVFFSCNGGFIEYSWPWPKTWPREIWWHRWAEAHEVSLRSILRNIVTWLPYWPSFWSFPAPNIF